MSTEVGLHVAAMDCTTEETCSPSTTLCTVKDNAATGYKNVQIAHTDTVTDCNTLMFPVATKKYSSLTVTALAWLEGGNNACSGLCTATPMRYWTDVNLAPLSSCKDTLLTLVINNFTIVWVIALIIACFSIFSVLASFFLCCHPENKANKKED